MSLQSWTDCHRILNLRYWVSKTIYYGLIKYDEYIYDCRMLSRVDFNILPQKMNTMGQLSPTLILSIILGYFAVLIGISYLTAGKGDNKAFFTANRSSPWYLVAFGMIGATLSGVTFISIPGLVGRLEGANTNFSYMQMVFGYLVGYTVIALVLMPIYYKQNLTSIYSYLEKQLGISAYKTGAGFFILSRVIQAAFRLYLVAFVLDIFVTGPLGISFSVTVIITILLIWIYTFKGGIKTIVITDTFQTLSMLVAVVLTIYSIMNSMDIGWSGAFDLIAEKGYDKVFQFENGWGDSNNFFKQFLSGALLAIVMTGLDQDMMQKNLTCRSLGDAQKNMFSFSFVLVFVNILFLTLGALLYIYANQNGIGIPERTDQLFPLIAIEHLSPIVGIFFILGLIAVKVHIGFSVMLFLVIMVFNSFNDDSVLNKIFEVAGYTYGPILGLFCFSILTNRRPNNDLVLPVCIVAPIVSYAINYYSATLLGGFKWGYMILALNGLLTFLLLWAISRPERNSNAKISSGTTN